ncbi:MAG: hypothetical protein AAF497_14815 [Planctomycetota bacterium]
MLSFCFCGIITQSGAGAFPRLTVWGESETQKSGCVFESPAGLLSNH